MKVFSLIVGLFTLVLAWFYAGFLYAEWLQTKKAAEPPPAASFLSHDTGIMGLDDEIVLVVHGEKVVTMYRDGLEQACAELEKE
jgi:hypothetical protein